MLRGGGEGREVIDESCQFSPIILYTHRVTFENFAKVFLFIQVIQSFGIFFEYSFHSQFHAREIQILRLTFASNTRYDMIEVKSSGNIINCISRQH